MRDALPNPGQEAPGNPKNMAHSIWMTAKKGSGFKKKLFWIISRAALWCYRQAPIFGPLRASLGIIRKENCVLVIRRNDGRGLCFPGGLALPWENDEKTLVREVREETGLQLENFEFAFRYESRADIPARISVFRVQASGEIRGSWEGSPEWAKLSELSEGILPSQEYIVNQLLAASAKPAILDS
jgi:8-oxo-dGTP pyrophosphatase MutT (NUDIX family)